jgi:catechol 2,3-dioxygenase-like lactoylglutathione lyase family enzyme
MPRLNGVLETALYVDELPRARRFYDEVMDLVPAFADQRLCAYEIAPKSVLLLFPRGQTLETVVMPGGTIPPHDSHGPLHVAFAIASEDLAPWEAQLARHGIPVEGRTEWPRGGTSLYFRDPDGHLLELATPGLWQGY